MSVVYESKTKVNESTNSWMNEIIKKEILNKLTSLNQKESNKN